MLKLAQKRGYTLTDGPGASQQRLLHPVDPDFAPWVLDAQALFDIRAAEIICALS